MSDPQSALAPVCAITFVHRASSLGYYSSVAMGVKLHRVPVPA